MLCFKCQLFILTFLGSILPEELQTRFISLLDKDLNNLIAEVNLGFRTKRLIA